MSNLRLGLPSKGRLAEVVGALVTDAGLSFRRQERSLFARCREMPVDVTFLRTGDIPVLCAEGAIDLGITGSDLVAESEVELISRLELGVGRCRLAMCVPESSTFHTAEHLEGCRIATSFPRITQRFLNSAGISAHTVSLSGSVEIMIALGVAHAIVDLIDTGSTLAANHLRVLAEIGRYQCVLVQNAGRRQADIADRVVRMLEGVVIARAYTLLEYNVPRSKLPDAEKITPGFNSPTVSALEDSDWCAVQVMVRRDEVIDVMQRLESLGASAIIEMQIANCRL